MNRHQLMEKTCSVCCKNGEEIISLASGFVILNKGQFIFITARHVLMDAKKLMIEKKFQSPLFLVWPERKIETTLDSEPSNWNLNEQLDCAWYKLENIEGFDWESIRIPVMNELSFGDRTLWHSGFPLGVGNGAFSRPTIVTSFRVHEPGFCFTVDSGMGGFSGGPVAVLSIEQGIGFTYEHPTYGVIGVHTSTLTRNAGTMGRFSLLYKILE
ncbi:hypothetical protein HK103_002527 [Boothiomyces macroporosus]|uniref:Serine protease n=1 Tax=Boothiomyces macroporosus TaxID=261099 RepID=A0AAD5UN67_9FUNG|nr:hypothetical protein HK103_002527 [Boothiomyces macroporosus]